MLAEEMLFYTISQLDKEFKLAPAGSEITWYSTYFSDVPQRQMENIINKFVKEYGAIEFVKPWEFYRSFNGSTSYSYCKIRKTDNFDEVYLKLTNEYNRVQNLSKKNDDNNKDKTVLKLSYTDDRKLIINGIFLLSNPRYNSINDRMLRFLIEHPNKTYSRKDLEKEGVLKVEAKEDKDFYVFLDDIGMKGDLKKAFFSKGITKNSICLTNPVTQDDLRENGIDSIDLRTIKKA